MATKTATKAATKAAPKAAAAEKSTKSTTAPTVTLKQIASDLAEKHELTKKQTNLIMDDLVAHLVKKSEKGQSCPYGRPWDPSGSQARSPHGPQPRNRRIHQNSGEESC